MRSFRQSWFTRLMLCLLGALAASAFVFGPSLAWSSSQTKKVQPRIFYAEDVEKGLKNYVGIPYELGGFSRDGLDCSGFVRHAFKRIFGVDLPHNSRDQSTFPGFKKITAGGLKTGDLLFFSSSPKSKAITHVGVYISSERFIHSQGKKGVIISRLDGTYWKPRLRAARRLAGIEIRPKAVDSAMASASWNLSLSEGSDVIFDLTILRLPQVDVPDSPISGLPKWARHTDEVWQPLLQSFQAGYAHGEDSWGLEIVAFRDEIPANIPWHIQRNEPVMGFQAMDMAGGTYQREGFRIGGSFLTEEGVTLRPSFGLLNYRNLADRKDLARRTLDVGVEVASESSGWSIAADLLYSDKRMGMDYLFDTEDNAISVDMSLTLRHQLNDRLGFSITGQRSLNDFAELDDAQGVPGTVQKSLFFKLDLRY